MSQFKYLLREIISLLGDDNFKLELKTFRCAFQRLKIRLRNNQMIGQVKQLVTANRKLQNDFSVSLLRSYGERAEHQTGKNQKHAYRSIHDFISKLIKFLDETLDKTINIYARTQSHYKIGHLIHHLMAIRTSISRIRVCFKALLVYACDLYLEVAWNVNDQLSKEDIADIMGKHECKMRPEEEPKEQGEVEELNETVSSDDIGTLIDRDTMQPV